MIYNGFSAIFHCIAFTITAIVICFYHLFASEFLHSSSIPSYSIFLSPCSPPAPQPAAGYLVLFVFCSVNLYPLFPGALCVFTRSMGINSSGKCCFFSRYISWHMPGPESSGFLTGLGQGILHNIGISGLQGAGSCSFCCHSAFWP